jgi:hypothetical protein
MTRIGPVALAAALAAAGCGDGVTVTVVHVDARPGVRDATSLSVELGNANATLTQDFDLGGRGFPTDFSVTTPGRSGVLDLTVRALDGDGAIVGIAAAQTAIDPGGQTNVDVLLAPADFQVNTDFAGAQRTVFYFSSGGRQIDATGDGTFTVAFSDDCGTLARCDEWGRRFDATGAAQTTVIAASDAQFNVNRSDIFGTDPAVAIGGDGTMIATWTTQDEIVCSAIAPDGSAATPLEVVLSGGTVPDHPGVAAMGTDRFLVAWQEDDATSGSPVIRARLVDRTCTPLVNPNSGDAGPFLVSSTTNPIPDQPAVAAAADGSAAAIVWHAGQTLRGRFLDATATLDAGDVPVLSVAPGDTLWGPQLTAIAGGWALVYGRVTADQTLPMGGYVMRRLDPTGGQLGLDTVVTQPTPDAFSSPSVASRADGAIAVAWHGCGTDGDGDGCGVWLQLVRPTGLPVAGRVQVDTTAAGDQTDASVTALPDGFAVAWTDGSMAGPDQSETGIRARIIYPVYDDARGVSGAACDGGSPCADGLVCTADGDGADRCHPTCDPTGVPPQCPGGGVCTDGACLF